MIEAKTLKGTIELSDRDVEGFRRRLVGRLLLPGHDGYDDARTIWNRMIDRRPALIARCAGVDDIAHAVRFAREHDLLLSVRGGGHNVTGASVCDGGLMIETSLMKAVRVDAAGRRVTVEPGLTWKDFDVATQPFGLATTGGIVSSTGVPGLTLGGGHGWLARKHGLTCDNLISARIVTADGAIVTANADEHPDLFWAIRGGGGNFGVVVSFEFRLHPVTHVVAGSRLYPMTRAADVLAFYREYASAAPDDLTVYVLITVWSDGRPVIAIVPCYNGPPERADEILRPLERLGAPLLDTVRRVPYGEWQTMLDATNTPGAWYYKSGYLDDGKVRDERFIDTLLGQCDFASPSPFSRIVIEHLGGAVGRVAPDATAFTHRTGTFDLIVIAGNFRPDETDKNVAWARRAWSAMRSFMSGGVYVNYLDADEGAERVKAAYGPTYERLQSVKRRYDPDNILRLNHNIRAQSEFGDSNASVASRMKMPPGCRPRRHAGAGAAGGAVGRREKVLSTSYPRCAFTQLGG